MKPRLPKPFSPSAPQTLRPSDPQTLSTSCDYKAQDLGFGFGVQGLGSAAEGFWIGVWGCDDDPSALRPSAPRPLMTW